MAFLKATNMITINGSSYKNIEVNQQLSFKIFLMITWSMGAIFTDIYLPSVSQMANYYSVGINDVQFTITVYIIGLSFGALFISPLSDIFGRKQVILFSGILLLLSSISALVFVETHVSIFFLLVSRLFQGIAISGICATTRALTKDIISDKQDLAKLNASILIVVPLAIAVAPIIGGFVTNYLHWQYNFYILLGIVTYFIGYVFFKLPKRQTASSQYAFIDARKIINDILYRYIRLCKNKKFLYGCLVTGLLTTCFYVYLTLSPVLFETDLKLLPEECGVAYFVISSITLVSRNINKQLLSKYSVDVIATIGVCLIFISGFMLLLLNIKHLPSNFTILCMFGTFLLGFSLSSSNFSTIAIDSINSSDLGVASALFSGIQMGVSSIGTFSLNFIHSVQEGMCIRIFAIAFILLSLFSLILIKLRTCTEP